VLSMIDQDVTKAQFSAFPADVSMRLLTAAESDLTTWSDSLLAAWAADDTEAISRARHALKGLCGNFGASKLLELALSDLTSHIGRADFLALRDATLQAIRAVALGDRNASLQ
jgi:chemotaxis protein histidine kinase CheA